MHALSVNLHLPFLVLLAQEPATTQSEPLTSKQAIELPGVEGRIDHLAVDLARGRLFVAALGNDSVEVVDLVAGKHAQSLRGPKEPQGARAWRASAANAPLDRGG
jgi:hypothetical protein